MGLWNARDAVLTTKPTRTIAASVRTLAKKVMYVGKVHVQRHVARKKSDAMTVVSRQRQPWTTVGLVGKSAGGTKCARKASVSRPVTPDSPTATETVSTWILITTTVGVVTLSVHLRPNAPMGNAVHLARTDSPIAVASALT